MKFAKLVVALAATLLLLAILVLPQIIEAKRARAAATLGAGPQKKSDVTVVASTKNDTSPPLREMPQLPYTGKPQKEANKNPKIPHSHKDSSRSGGAVRRNDGAFSDSCPAPQTTLTEFRFPAWLATARRPTQMAKLAPLSTCR